jgi:hypothetical protein
VNHQIEHDIDIETAIRKRAEPMDFDEARMVEQRPHSRNGRIEPLGMTDAEHRAGRRSRVDQLLRFPDIARQRFFHEHRRPALEERQRHGQVRFRRNGN